MWTSQACGSGLHGAPLPPSQCEALAKPQSERVLEGEAVGTLGVAPGAHHDLIGEEHNGPPEGQCGQITSSSSSSHLNNTSY